MRWKGPFAFEFEEKSMKCETTTWSEISKGGKAIVEQIIESKEKINPKQHDYESYIQGSD